PSNSKYIFGPSVWLRGLIKPPRGHGIAYVDWSQQEFGIAAALSGDLTMQAAYHSGDPYLAFAKQAGAVPPDATKATHGPTRRTFQAMRPSRSIRDGGAVACAANCAASGRRPRPAAGPPRNISTLLGLVGRCRRPGHVVGRDPHGVRLAGAHKRAIEPEIAAQFPNASQWRGDAADRLLLGD